MERMNERKREECLRKKIKKIRRFKYRKLTISPTKLAISSTRVISSKKIIRTTKWRF